MSNNFKIRYIHTERFNKRYCHQLGIFNTAAGYDSYGTMMDSTDNGTGFDGYDCPRSSRVNGHINSKLMVFSMYFNRHDDEIIFGIEGKFNHTFKAAPEDRARGGREQRIYGLLTCGDFNRESQTSARLGL